MRRDGAIGKATRRPSKPGLGQPLALARSPCPDGYGRHESRQPSITPPPSLTYSSYSSHNSPNMPEGFAAAPPPHFPSFVSASGPDGYAPAPVHLPPPAAMGRAPPMMMPQQQQQQAWDAAPKQYGDDEFFGAQFGLSYPHSAALEHVAVSSGYDQPGLYAGQDYQYRLP